MNLSGECSSEDASSEVSEGRYRALFEYAPDGILIADTEGYYLDANPSMCAMLGYTRDELIGLHSKQIIAIDEHSYIEPVLDELRTGSRHHRQWSFRRKDGSVFEAEVFATTMPDGKVLGMVRDISLARAHEQEILRLSHLYEALSQINHALITHSTRDALLQRICQILTVSGGMRIAWVGWHNPVTHQLEPIAVYGEDADYIRAIKVYGDERLDGMGPSGIAFRTGLPFVCNDMQNDPITLPWRKEILRRNFRASAVIPIRENDCVCGTLSVYADKAFFFHDKEIALLEEAGKNISFALNNILREEARKRAETIVSSERRFSSTMLDSMPGIMYFYDAEGRFLRWNKNFENVSGYTSGEIARMHPLDFFQDEHKELLKKRILEVFTNGESSIEAPFRCKDGTLRPHFFTGRKLHFNGMDCLVGVGIDISARQEAEAKLAESEQKYRELVELANSIILRWDAQGRITFLNEYGQQFFGYSSEEIVGRHVMETLVPHVDSEGHDLKALMDRICANPKAYEYNVNENVRRSGERVWISWTNRFVKDEAGNVTEILSIGTNITEQRQAELAIHQLNNTLEQRVIQRTEELNSALIRAESADKLKSAFLATMSHEFRTPLNSIIGFTGIILKGLAGPLNEEQAKQLNMVRASARHLLELINDVLDISKIEAGQVEVHPEPFDLLESLERVVATIQPMAKKKGLLLTWDVATDIKEMTSDRRRLEQILLNLLNNAIKFTEHGSVNLTVEAGQLQSLQNDDVPAVRFSIRDTGIGIKSEDLETLFQPFHQIDSGLTRQHEGTGLGLAICRKLAIMLGGGVTANSEWGVGSEFVVVLPLTTVRPAV